MPVWVRTKIKKLKNPTTLCSFSSTPLWVRARRKIPTNPRSSYLGINYKDFSPIMQKPPVKRRILFTRKKPTMNLEINEKLDK